VLGRLKKVRRSGRGHVALCPAHDDRRPSMSITEVGDRILLHCFVGCSIENICNSLGISVSNLFVKGNSATDRDWSDQRRWEYARSIWCGSRPAPRTVVERYLRNRGITMPIPAAIRFIALQKHRDYGWPFPVLVAGLQDANGAFAAASLTWLCADGSDKAPVDPTRKIYGRFRHSAVRLAPAGNTLVLCEGVETGLSIAQACPELPVWCALSATNLLHVAIPPSVNTVILAADADPAGGAGAQAAAYRLMRQGRTVRIAPSGRPGQDFNDLRL
jgi:hypothetical protein